MYPSEVTPNLAGLSIIYVTKSRTRSLIACWFSRLLLHFLAVRPVASGVVSLSVLAGVDLRVGVPKVDPTEPNVSSKSSNSSRPVISPVYGFNTSFDWSGR